MAERDKDNNFSYYFKLLIKIIIFIVSVYYIFKYRATIRRYISIINRWLRFSSPLRNINTRFRNFRERGLNAQRQPLLDDIEREFQENIQANVQADVQENFNPGNIQGGLAAAAAGGYVRNRVREIDQLESQNTLPRRSGRVSNWLGPIKERAYRERRETMGRDRELDLQRKREEKEIVLAKTGGTTIPYLKNWLTQQGYAQPADKDLQSYWDLVLGKTVPTSLAAQPRFTGETSSAPLRDIRDIRDIRDLDNFNLPGNQGGTGMYYPTPRVPNFLDNQFRPVDFGRRNRNRNRRR